MTLKEKKFVEVVWDFYAKNKRTHLSWRKTKDPYKILVSEVMLQQTQVERVIDKYVAFLKAFPTVDVLARAQLRDVLLLWQGLGYNRRAKMLHASAQAIMKEYNGKFPKSVEELEMLPGIGLYTASAVVTFAYNQAVPMIETNIRSVFIHHFFRTQTDITDKDISRLTARFVGLTESPREWYYALMDYGSYIKKTHGNPNKRGASYIVQSRFEGSDRQIRGAVLRTLLREPLSRKKMLATLKQFEDARVDAQVEKMIAEGLLVIVKGKYAVA